MYRRAADLLSKEDTISVEVSKDLLSKALLCKCELRCLSKEVIIVLMTISY